MENLEESDEPALSLLQTSMRFSRSLAERLHGVSDQINLITNASVSTTKTSEAQKPALKELDPSLASMLEQSESFSYTPASSKEHQAGGNQSFALPDDPYAALRMLKQLALHCESMSGRHQVPDEDPECSNSKMWFVYKMLSNLTTTTETYHERSELQVAQAILNDTDQKFRARVRALSASLANAVEGSKQLVQLREEMAKVAWSQNWWEEKANHESPANSKNVDELALIVQRLEKLQTGVLTNASMQEKGQEQAELNLLEFNHVYGRPSNEQAWPLVRSSQATVPSSGLWLCDVGNWQEGWGCFASSMKSIAGSLIAFAVVLGVLTVASCCTALKQPKSSRKSTYQ